MARAIQTAFDNLYTLRDQVQAMSAAGKASGGDGGAGGAKDASASGAKAFNDNIQGLKVKAATDPSTLKDGYTLRWNAKSAQFEFGA